MATSALGWPEPYLKVGEITGSPHTPTWSKQDVLDAGAKLAELFITDRALASDYLAVVQQYDPRDPMDLTSKYKLVILRALGRPASTSFNANDFANIHRATWLFMLEAFACLVNKNPHGKMPTGENDWGDPDADADPPTSRGDEDDPPASPPMTMGGTRCFHHIPNSRGYFAITSNDIPPPVLTT